MATQTSAVGATAGMSSRRPATGGRVASTLLAVLVAFCATLSLPAAASALGSPPRVGGAAPHSTAALPELSAAISVLAQRHAATRGAARDPGPPRLIRDTRGDHAAPQLGAAARLASRHLPTVRAGQWAPSGPSGAAPRVLRPVLHPGRAPPSPVGT